MSNWMLFWLLGPPFWLLCGWLGYMFMGYQWERDVPYAQREAHRRR